MSTVIGGSDIEVEKIVIDGAGYDGDFNESGVVDVTDLIAMMRGQDPQIHAKGAVQTGLALFSETLNSGGGGWMLCAGDGDNDNTDLVDAIWSIGGSGIQSSSKITAPEFVGDGSGLTNLPSSGGGYNLQVFTSSGTYTKTSGVKSIKVTVTGGGGGALIKGGGAGGTSIEHWSDANSITSSTVPVTVGAGGASGSNGSTSSFGSYCSATGGSTGNSSDGGNGGDGSGGTINIKGGGGGFGSTGNWGGIGGASFWAGGGESHTNGSAQPPGGYGAGGGGGIYYNRSSSGTAGIVMVEEFL